MNTFDIEITVETKSVDEAFNKLRPTIDMGGEIVPPKKELVFDSTSAKVYIGDDLTRSFAEIVSAIEFTPIVDELYYGYLVGYLVGYLDGYLYEHI